MMVLSISSCLYFYFFASSSLSFAHYLPQTDLTLWKPSLPPITVIVLDTSNDLSIPPFKSYRDHWHLVGFLIPQALPLPSKLWRTLKAKRKPLVSLFILCLLLSSRHNFNEQKRHSFSCSTPSRQVPCFTYFHLRTEFYLHTCGWEKDRKLVRMPLCVSEDVCLWIQTELSCESHSKLLNSRRTPFLYPHRKCLSLLLGPLYLQHLFEAYDEEVWLFKRKCKFMQVIN